MAAYYFINEDFQISEKCSPETILIPQPGQHFCCHSVRINGKFEKWLGHEIYNFCKNKTMPSHFLQYKGHKNTAKSGVICRLDENGKPVEEKHEIPDPKKYIIIPQDPPKFTTLPENRISSTFLVDMKTCIEVNPCQHPVMLNGEVTTMSQPEIRRICQTNGWPIPNHFQVCVEHRPNCNCI